MRFRTPSWDNAIFEQAVKGYAHFGAPIVDVKGVGFNQLGDHFSPILVMIAPFYRIFPAAQTILMAQTVLIGISIAIVTAIARQHLGPANAVAIAIAYGLSFGIQSAVDADFHEVAFAVPFLALAGGAYLRQDWRHVLLWSWPLLLIKEDMGLTVTAIAAVMFLQGERRRGILLAAIGLLTMVLAILVVIPYFSPTGEWQYFSSFGDSRGLARVLFDAPLRKTLTVILTFGITGMLALLSPWSLVAIPTFAIRFAADKEAYWGTDWHYSLVLMPIVFIALIDAMRKERRRAWLRDYASKGAAVSLAFVAAMQLQSPLSAMAQADWWSSSPHDNAAREAISMVPAGASVETDLRFMTHLVTKHRVYWIGSIGGTGVRADPDYVLFNTEGNLGSPENTVAYAEATHGGSWHLIFNQLGYQLATRDPAPPT